MTDDRTTNRPRVARLIIEVGEPDIPLPFSPLLASIEKREVDPEIPPEVRNDFRAVTEIKIAEHLEDIVSGKAGLGHFAFSNNCGEDHDRLAFYDEVESFFSRDLERQFTPESLGRVPARLRSHDVVATFLNALRDLRLGEALATNLGRLGQPLLISKIDLYRHFCQVSPEDWSEPVKNYLDAYVRLIEVADSFDDDYSRFWARYPMSTSIWHMGDNQARLSAVMASPYHPLRIAWLTSVQGILRESQGKWVKFLAGGVAGWQFPYFSTSRFSAGRLLSLPLDGGRDSIFAGWSMLVPTRVDELGILEIPERAGNLIMPGVASDGLSAASVATATEKFFDLNPFISSIIVDLTARSRTPKTDAVDEGIISAIQGWRSRRAARGLSLGGVKVFDNSLREGGLVSAVDDLADHDSANRAPYSWTRYSGSQPSQAVNIRVLGDSGMNYLAGNSNVGLVTGSIGPHFLRRFDVVGSRDDGSSAYLEPTLLGEDGSTNIRNSFLTALQAHESMPGRGDLRALAESEVHERRGMRFEVKAGPSSVIGADWVIGGDSSLPPTVLSRMLRHNRPANQRQFTIWDWHPPMFGSVASERVGTIDLRPYVVVATLTEAFKGRLDTIICKSDPALVGDRGKLEEIREEVLQTLGSRGIGVSSLFANHKHLTPQRGAMGFWQVLDLIARDSRDEREILAIPLDKIDRLIDGLSGRRVEDRRRADLLLIELTEGRIRLAPLEIKFLRIDNPKDELTNPLFADNELLSAFEQVEMTLSRCKEIIENLDEARASDMATAALVWNAFATLVDIGIRLSPNIARDPARRARVARWLQSVAAVDSRLTVGLGQPIVAYLEAHDGDLRSRVGPPIGRNNLVLYQADPRDIMNDRSNGGGTAKHFLEALDLVFGSHDADGPDHNFLGHSISDAERPSTTSVSADHDLQHETATKVEVPGSLGTDSVFPSAGQIDDHRATISQDAAEYGDEEITPPSTVDPSSVRTPDMTESWGVRFEVGEVLDG